MKIGMIEASNKEVLNAQEKEAKDQCIIESKELNGKELNGKEAHLNGKFMIGMKGNGNGKCHAEVKN